MTDRPEAGEREGAQVPRNEDAQGLRSVVLAIGAAIAAAHSADFQALMLDLVQRAGDRDPSPRRDAVLAALRPGDPMGPGQHILDAVRTVLGTHAAVGEELAAMASPTSPLAMLGAINDQDPAAIAATAYAFQTLQHAVDATIAAAATLPEVRRIAIAATGDPDGAIAAARKSSTAMTALAALLDEDSTPPMELVAAARARIG